MKFSLLVAAAAALAVFALCSVAVSADPLPPAANEPLPPYERPARPNTLVVLEHYGIQASHSIFFSTLRARGHTLTFAEVSEKPVLQEFGKFNYDNLILFTGQVTDLGRTLAVGKLTDFVDSGRNVLVVGDVNVTDTFRELANECGVDFDNEATSVLDHSNYDLELDDGSHTTIATDKWNTNLQSVLGNGPSAPVLFSGISVAVNDASPYVMTVLSGSKSSYSYSPSARFPADGSFVGKQNGGVNTRLVAAVQMVNNARVVFAGSSALFSDRYIQSPVVTSAKRWDKSGNGDFVSELTKWNFQDRALLRATELTHNAASKSERNPRTYRIGDELEFSVLIEEYDGSALAWKPFTNTDVQLEFVMMDPYIRTTLKTNGRGLYTTRFQVPDTMGVYKFRIAYKSAGYSNLVAESQVAVRPFRHDEYERFLVPAYPYYAGAFSMMAGFFIFSLVFLYQKE